MKLAVALRRCMARGCNRKSAGAIAAVYPEQLPDGSLRVHRPIMSYCDRRHRRAVLDQLVADTGVTEFEYVTLKLNEVEQWLIDTDVELLRRMKEAGSEPLGPATLTIHTAEP